MIHLHTNSPDRQVSVDMDNAVNVGDIIVRDSPPRNTGSTGSTMMLSPPKTSPRRESPPSRYSPRYRDSPRSPRNRTPRYRDSPPKDSPKHSPKSEDPLAEPSNDVLGLDMLANPRKKKTPKPPTHDSDSENNETQALFDRNDPPERSPHHSPLPATSPRRDSTRRSRTPMRTPTRTPNRTPRHSYRRSYSRDRYERPKLTYEEQQQRKIELLDGFDKLERRGVRIRKPFDMNTSLDEMEYEYARLKKSIEVEQSIQFSRKMLMAFITLVEYLNNRYDPFDLNLDGWSESVMEDIQNYDQIFEELHEKYKSKVQMAPELKLIFSVGGSAFMFHLTSTLFKNTMPGISNNPAMMKGVRKMAMGAMSGAMGGKGAMAGMMPGMSGLMGGMGMRQPRPSNSTPASHAHAPPPPPPQRDEQRQMRGPTNDMDDLLNNIINQDPNDIDPNLANDIDNILNNENRFSDAEENGDNSSEEQIRNVKAQKR